MTKTEQFHRLLKEGSVTGKVLFRPILMQFAAEYIGSNYGAFASDYRVLAEANLRCLEDLDLDFIGLISDPYRETAAFGARIKYVDDGVPRCLDRLVSTLDDVKALKRPDVYRSERTADRIKAGELLANRTQGSVPIIGWIEGPLAEACDLAGMELVMIQLLLDPDFCNLLMDKCMQTAKDFAKAQIEAGCEIIGIGDAVCSQIDASTYQTYVRERHRELIDFIHASGGKVKLHICGDTNHLLPEYSGLGIDLLDLDHQVDIDHARKVLGDEIILTGNINPVLIKDQSAEVIFKICHDLARKHHNERFILAAGCEIPSGTPVNNLKAMNQSRRIIRKVVD